MRRRNVRARMRTVGKPCRAHHTDLYCVSTSFCACWPCAGVGGYGARSGLAAFSTRNTSATWSRTFCNCSLFRCSRSAASARACSASSIALCATRDDTRSAPLFTWGTATKEGQRSTFCQRQNPFSYSLLARQPSVDILFRTSLHTLLYLVLL